MCSLQTLTPPFQRWTAPFAADWSDRSKESAYMCGEKKTTRQSNGQNTPANQDSLQGQKLVILNGMKEKESSEREQEIL